MPSEFVDNFLSYPADRQRQKHNFGVDTKLWKYNYREKLQRNHTMLYIISEMFWQQKPQQMDNQTSEKWVSRV